MVIIRSENLTRRFESVLAVNRLNLEVKKGEIFGLVGPDGAGKTTTMRMLTGILRPTGGDAWILGHPLSRESERLKDRIGYMAQRFALYGDLTVRENILFYADLYAVPQKERPTKISRLLDFSQLGPFQNRMAQNLSGGMKQKLGLACALIHTPEILFLDEPTSGVDPLSRRDFWRILYELLRQGVTIFISTSYLDEAERCHRIGLLHQGTLLSVGTPEEIKGLLQEDLWEIRCPDRMGVRKIIRSLPEVQSTGIFGDRLHAVWSGGEETRQKVEQVLQEAGFEIMGMRKIDPNLEDIFIHTLIREGRGNPPAAVAR